MKELTKNLTITRYRQGNFIIKEHDEGRKDLISLKDREFIENVMNKYIHKNSFELSRITQLPDTPWYNTVTEKGMYKVPFNTSIL